MKKKKHKVEQTQDIHSEQCAKMMNTFQIDAAPTCSNNICEHVSFSQQQQQALVEQIQNRIFALEDAVFLNSQRIAQLLQQQDDVQAKWHHLVAVELANVYVQDRKSMKLLAVNAKGAAFMNKYSVNNMIEAMRKPGKLLPVLPPLLLLLHLNAMHGKKVKKLSFKIFVPVITVLMQAHMHYDDDDYYWYEISAVESAVFDDAYAVDDVVAPATMQLPLPTHDPELAYSLYLKASRDRDCKMIAEFVQQNDKQFVVETSNLLHHAFLE